MTHSSSALAEILKGKIPTVMYDALGNELFLSQRGLDSPAEVLDLITSVVGRGRRPVFESALLLKIAHALAESDLLNAAGKRFAARPASEAWLLRTEERPMTKQEYLERLRVNHERYPAVVGCESPPPEWVAEAWDLREIREMMFGGMVDDVRRYGRIWPDAVPFLEGLSPYLRTDRVVEAFLYTREICPDKEGMFREQFEQVFRQHVAALPPRMSRQEVLDWLRIENRSGQWFSDGKPVTREQLIDWHWLDETGARWLLDGVPDAGDRAS